eukprot:c18205_g1_i1.p1 GENE.c18205_g1_i1~~c18205_g1_i1.p1  ORF type:complete len:346 (-),score=57.25 c18205_g1_i1:35-1072(-)
MLKLVVLCALGAGALGDVLVSTQFFTNSDCTGSVFNQQSRRVNYVSCAVFRAALGSCEEGQCCDSGLGFYTIAECSELGDSNVCGVFESAALTACRIDTSIQLCLDQTPTVACCSSLLLWSASCSDTSAVRPSGLLGLVCPYKPNNAQQYFDDKCGDFSSGCSAVSTAVTSLCVDDNGCPSSTPSRECCTAIDALSLLSPDTCDLPQGSCATTNTVSLPHLKSLCQGGGPDVSPSPNPTPISLRSAPVRSCTFIWQNSPQCEGPPDSTDCSAVHGAANCQEFVREEGRRYADTTTIIGASCREKECCSLSDQSYMFVCADSENSATLLSVSFVLILPLFLASFLF